MISETRAGRSSSPKKQNAPLRWGACYFRQCSPLILLRLCRVFMGPIVTLLVVVRVGGVVDIILRRCFRVFFVGIISILVVPIVLIVGLAFLHLIALILILLLSLAVAHMPSTAFRRGSGRASLRNGRLFLLLRRGLLLVRDGGLLLVPQQIRLLVAAGFF